MDLLGKIENGWRFQVLGVRCQEKETQKLNTETLACINGPALRTRFII